MENSRDIGLFLGAGFSCDADLPTMSKFGTASEHELKDQINEWSNSNHYSEPIKYFTHAGYIFKGFQDYCKTAEKFISFDLNNMEDIFCYAEQYKFINEKEKIELNFKIDEKVKDCIKLKNKEQININKIYKNIKIWLWKIYHQMPPLNSERKNNTNSESYNSLFKLIEKIKNRLTVITTNYDIVFEYFSFKNDIKCGYPFDSNDKCVNSIEKDRNNKYVYPYEIENSPVLCKLHGSVNYFEEYCNFYISDELDNKNEPRPNLLWVNNGYNTIKDKDIFIIPPTYSKLQESKHLKKIWKFAHDSLINAKKIIFIGYSFPESDAFMKSFIQTAMAKRKTNSLLNIYVIDPSLDVHIRYNKLFKPNEPKKIHIEYIVKPFTKAISDIKNMIEI